MSYFSEKAPSRSLDKNEIVSEIVANFSRKEPEYTLKDEQDEIILGWFHKNEEKGFKKDLDHVHVRPRSFKIELVPTRYAQLIPDIRRSYYTNFLRRN